MDLGLGLRVHRFTGLGSRCRAGGDSKDLMTPMSQIMTTQFQLSSS